MAQVYCLPHLLHTDYAASIKAATHQHEAYSASRKYNVYKVNPAFGSWAVFGSTYNEPSISMKKNFGKKEKGHCTTRSKISAQLLA